MVFFIHRDRIAALAGHMFESAHHRLNRISLGNRNLRCTVKKKKGKCPFIF